MIAPPPSSTATTLFGNIPRPIFSKPNMVAATPILTTAKPYPSNRSRRSSLKLPIYFMARARPRIPIGILIRNIQRQLPKVEMNPPSGGPSIGPIRAGTVSQAIALTRSCLGIERSTTRRPTGTIIAPPIPCKMRAPTNSGKLFTAEQATDPSVKTTMAEQKTVRAPNLSAIQPDIGMKMPSDSR